MGNEIYKQHGFFYMYVCFDVVMHFVMSLVTMIHHKKYTCLQIIPFLSFVCTLHIGAFFIHKIHGHVHFHDFGIRWWKKLEIYPKINVFNDKFTKTWCFIIVISCTCDRVNSYQFCYINRLLVWAPCIMHMCVISTVFGSCFSSFKKLLSFLLFIFMCFLFLFLFCIIKIKCFFFTFVFLFLWMQV
jgi:hypothetical protein